MYVQRNIEARSCNRYCSGKAMSITQHACVYCSLRYPACNAHAPYCLPWPASDLQYFFSHCLINCTILEKVIEHKMCFDNLYNFCLIYFSF